MLCFFLSLVDKSVVEEVEEVEEEVEEVEEMEKSNSGPRSSPLTHSKTLIAGRF